MPEAGGRMVLLEVARWKWLQNIVESCRILLKEEEVEMEVGEAEGEEGGEEGEEEEEGFREQQAEPIS